MPVGVAVKLFTTLPPSSRIRTIGVTPASGVLPCWSTVMSTGQSSFAGRPAGGSELRPTVAQPPALAAGTATAATATASTSRSFFIRTSVRVDAADTPAGARGFRYSTDSAELERLVAA